MSRGELRCQGNVVAPGNNSAEDEKPNVKLEEISLRPNIQCKFQDTDTEDTGIGTAQLKGNHYPPLHHFSDAIRLGVGRLAMLYEGDHHSELRNNRDTQTYTRAFGGLPVAQSPSNTSNPRARCVQTILYKRNYRTSIGQDFLAGKHISLEENRAPPSFQQLHGRLSSRQPTSTTTK
ncbi:hypothetical protein C8F01DRAFT_1234948 [Mycena amicta]|nr:hypothetical protein C8F01DRAFT_1234948 [Mycena amicta]